MPINRRRATVRPNRSRPWPKSRRSTGPSLVRTGTVKRTMKSTVIFALFVVAIAAVGQVASDVVICNYEKFDLYDAMYKKRQDDFCVFQNVFMSTDVRYGDFMASSLDYQKIAFTNSRFPIVPPSLYRNFDDIRELYVRRCNIETLRVTRLVEKMYAGSNQITSVSIDGNGSNNLKELYLESNMIKDIANLTNLPNLQVLVLENNPKLGNTDFAMFSRMTKLWKLDLENTGMTKIINTLRLDLTELKRLDLSNNQLTYIDMHQFHSFPKLENLWLSGNKMYFMEMEPIRAILPEIRSIVIDDNYWGCQHLAIISKYMLDNGIIIRQGECKSRNIHKVCCSDTTDLVDNRYLIEMKIRSESKLEESVKTLERDNLALLDTVEEMRVQLNSLILNYTAKMEEMRQTAIAARPVADPVEDPDSLESAEAEDYAYYESEERHKVVEAEAIEVTTEKSSAEDVSSEQNRVE
ncbi:conserved hypothetical protein [Culex quinquefasciatus]|uniref:Leucine-rich immune protein (Short) n=2 Tax=Culex quinquefasciatus TaxID=7176 RepID=B0X0D5_CULQU|nr:conserved hypothetical protein [Culex quinquefasciatus]|eukprot:XP_001863107.1 conserved hypothetical protein [Culex quinquefasciatus]